MKTRRCIKQTLNVPVGLVIDLVKTQWTINCVKDRRESEKGSLQSLSWPAGGDFTSRNNKSDSKEPRTLGTRDNGNIGPQECSKMGKQANGNKGL